MNEDRLSRESTREVFEAIVSQLEDPDLVRLRRLQVVLGVVAVALAVAFTVWGPMSWHSLLGFFFTFFPGMLIGRNILGRQFR